MINHYTRDVFAKIRENDFYNSYAEKGGTVITAASFVTLLGSIWSDNQLTGSAALLLMLGEFPSGDASILKPVNYQIGKGIEKLKNHFSKYF